MNQAKLDFQKLAFEDEDDTLDDFISFNTKPTGIMGTPDYGYLGVPNRRDIIQDIGENIQKNIEEAKERERRKLKLQLERENKIELYMKVLIDKVLQMIEGVLVLHVQIEQEHQQVVVDFCTKQVEEDQVINGKDKLVRLPEPKTDYDVSNQKQINRAITLVVEQLNSTFLNELKQEQERYSWFVSG